MEKRLSTALLARCRCWRRLLFGALCFFGLFSPGQAAAAGAPVVTAQNSNLPLERELARARELNRPVLTFIHTEWCEPCHQFIREILPRPEVQALLGRVHWVSYDAERGQGLEVATRLGVRGYPNFVLLTSEGTICRRLPGFIPDPKLFVQKIEAMLPLARSEDEVKAGLAGPMPGLSARLGAARWYALRSRFDDALGQLDEAARLGEQAGTAAEEAAAALWLGTKLRRAREICHYRDGDPTCHAADQDLPAWRRQLVADGVALVRRYPGTPAATEALRLAVLSGVLGEAERDELLGLAQEAAKGAGTLPLLALGAHAYDQALLLGQQGIKLAPRSASALQYLAEVYHYRGERAQALLMIDKARRLDATEGGSARAKLIALDRQRYRGAGRKGEPSPFVESMRRHVNHHLNTPGLDLENDL